jgi:hypothetical protein
VSVFTRRAVSLSEILTICAKTDCPLFLCDLSCSEMRLH